MSKDFQDEILLLKIKNGDLEAYGSIYDKYVDDIYRYIYFKVSDTYQAEDLTSDVFMKVFKYLCSDAVVDNIRSFLYQSSRNAVVDYYRTKDKREKEVEFNDELEKESDIDLESDIDRILTIEEIRKVLDKIKEEYKEVLLLKHVNGLENSEIATILDTSPGNVRVLIHRAHNALKKFLN